MSLPYTDGQAIPVHELANEYDEVHAFNIVYTDGSLDKEGPEEVILDGNDYKKVKNIYLKDATYVVVIWTSLIKGTTSYKTIYMKNRNGILDELRLQRNYVLGNKIDPHFAPIKGNPVPKRVIE